MRAAAAPVYALRLSLNSILCRSLLRWGGRGRRGGGGVRRHPVLEGRVERVRQAVRGWSGVSGYGVLTQVSVMDVSDVGGTGNWGELNQ